MLAICVRVFPSSIRALSRAAWLRQPFPSTPAVLRLRLTCFKRKYAAVTQAHSDQLLHPAQPTLVVERTVHRRCSCWASCCCGDAWQEGEVNARRKFRTAYGAGFPAASAAQAGRRLGAQQVR